MHFYENPSQKKFSEMAFEMVKNKEQFLKNKLNFIVFFLKAIEKYNYAFSL